jgi:Na+/H+ antiporter NhaD/arsenite permease-like protein
LALFLALVPTGSAFAQVIYQTGLPHAAHGGVDGAALPLWSALPFAGLLLSIAILPLIAPRFWQAHFGKATTLWSAAFAVPFVAAFGGAAWCDIGRALLVDYASFAILLFGLYVATGGVILRGTLRGRPATNVALLALGALLANFIGTIGASLLVIRPLLRANAWRKQRAHLAVFLIFLVGNIGGSLTALGNPPLFLGYLHGVDFFWTMRLLPIAGFSIALTLAVFFALDTALYRREGPPPRAGASQPLRVEGWRNVAVIAGMVVLIPLTGAWTLPGVRLGGIEIEGRDLLRNAAILALAALSLLVSDKHVRRDNEFSWTAMEEVAVLFAGVFVTLVPALLILRAGAAGAAAPLLAVVDKPWQFFWATGGLSSVLDNAPTYLAFFEAAIAKYYPGLDESAAVQLLMGRGAALAQHPNLLDGARHLLAISAGAAFMGALTYIGNAPNLMIKSVAEEFGVAMPTFFGYVFKYALPILATIFAAATFVFFT